MALEEFLGISNDKLLTSFAETLYMVGIALIIVTIVAFVLAIVLIFTRKGGLYQNVVIYNIINVIINIVRSTPFVVLLYKWEILGTFVENGELSTEKK